MRTSMYVTEAAWTSIRISSLAGTGSGASPSSRWSGPEKSRHRTARICRPLHSNRRTLLLEPLLSSRAQRGIFPRRGAVPHEDKIPRALGMTAGPHSIGMCAGLWAVADALGALRAGHLVRLRAAGLDRCVEDDLGRRDGAGDDGVHDAAVRSVADQHRVDLAVDHGLPRDLALVLGPHDLQRAQRGFRWRDALASGPWCLDLLDELRRRAGHLDRRDALLDLPL